jgi:hypothetical protein
MAGPASPYYLMDGHGHLDIVQGSSVLLSSPVVYASESPIAVDTSVRTIGYYNLATQGAQYTLAGVPTGTNYTRPAALDPSLTYDGTSDGAHNYTVGANNGRVYRTDPDWSNPVLLFAAPDGTHAYWLGITYDRTNNSLWLSSFNPTTGPSGSPSGQTVADFSFSGTLLSSFSTAHDELVALALDPADNSLWLANRHYLDNEPQIPHFEQYSKAGVLLGSQDYPTLAGQNILGGEFALVVPEPSTIVLAALGALGLIAVARRRRR